MDQKTAKALIDKYLAGQCTLEEQAQVETWYNQLAAQQKDKTELPDYEARNAQIKAGLPPDLTAQRKVVRLWPRIAVAASTLLILSLGVYFINRRAPKPVQAQLIDVAPGANGATLTLGNGHKILLNNTTQGQIAVQGNAVINRTPAGAIVYATNNAQSDGIIFNTVTTMRKEKYKITLVDGTKVWLNAESSIRYPTTFRGSKREVEITGEAYFEVAHNAKKPFYVKSNNETIQVLGTHFNVNAYSDEPEMKTTLLEGSVKISYNGQSALLKPGQQAIVSPSGQKINVTEANGKQAVAWKDGQFIFEHTALKTLMRQVARWYDLDVVYNGNVANDEFNGQVDANVNLSKMLRILQSGDVHFEIENKGNKKELIVTP